VNRLRLPGTALVSALAALTTWLTLTTWSGFSEEPGKYLGPLALGCALVGLSGALLRTARLHPIVVLLGQVALVAVWLNHRFAPDPSILGWLPTPTSVRDSFDVLRASTDAAQAYAAPVPESVPAFPPILILTGSLVAVLVDFLACGLRRVPVAGLPLLAMYTAPVSLLDEGVSWWKFALIAAAFLFLLAGEEAGRLAHWGRDLGLTPGATERQWARASNQTVWPSARKIGFTATAMAIVLPIFVPTFTGGMLSGAGGGGGPGGGGVRITNPILNMKRDLERDADVPWLLVRTSDPTPAYLRIAVLDVFDGSSWKPGKRALPVAHRVDGELPSPPGLDTSVSATTHSYQIVADEGFRSDWLPTPYPYESVDVPGDWRFDESTMDIVSLARGQTTSGIRYDLVGLDVEPTAAELESAGAIPTEIFSRYTLVDPDVPQEVGDLAKRVTATGTNRAERAALLQEWFAKPHADPADDPDFEYDLAKASDGSSIDALTDFLEGSRRGYCEQFAGAMALMARTLAIPARVAVGFLKPQQNADGDWIYSSHDMHAWPELYFEGVGWVIFEPTPSGRQGATSPPYTAGLRPAPQPTGGPTAANPTPTSAAPAVPTNRPLPDEPSVTDATGAGSGVRWLLVAPLVLLLLLVLGTVPRLSRMIVRRRRWATARTAVDRAEAAWAELRDSMLDLRLPWDDRVTARVRARDIGPLFCRRPGKGEEDLARVIRSNPEAQAALDRILLLLERARYARTVPDVEDVKNDVVLCAEALRIGVEPSVRRQADWLPVSLLSSRARRASPKGDAGLALSEPSLNR